MKKIIIAALLACALSIVPAAAWQPSKTIEVITAFAPGSGNEMIFRALAKPIEQANKAKFLVVHKPGAGGVVGTEQFYRLPADGNHAILLSYTGLYAMDKITVPDTKNRTYTTDSFSYVQVSASSPFVVIANPSDPVTNAEQLVALLKTNPKISFNSSGGSRLVYELLREKIKFKTGPEGVVRVEQPGPVPSIQSIAGGHVRFASVPLAVAYQFHKEGKIKIIALTGKESNPDLPGVKTLDSAMPGVVAVAYWGLALPKGTPNEVIDWYQKNFAESFNDKDVQEYYKQNMFYVDPSKLTPQATVEFVKQQEKFYQSLIDKVLAEEAAMKNCNPHFAACR